MKYSFLLALPVTIFSCMLQPGKDIAKENLQLNSLLDSVKKSKIDSVQIKLLKPYFNANKDEFDPTGRIWFKPKSAPEYTSINGFYCYFTSDTIGIPHNFRFRIQYSATDWVFFKECQFLIDGKALEYLPSRTETDTGSGYICEWSDEPVYESDLKLIEALSNAKEAKVKFIGKQYYQIKQITKEQTLNIKRSLDLYKAMGGTF